MTALSRPPHVMTACLFIGVSSLIVFGSVVSALSDWGSIELQAEVRRVLADARIADTGLTVTTAIEWLRRILLVVVVLSIAGMVFAVYAARGHRPSRVYLTVMCGITSVLFIAAGGLVGLIPAAFAVWCAVRLWSPQSGAWFDAKNGVAATPAAFATQPTPVALGRDQGSVPGSAPVGTTATTRAVHRPRPVLIAGIITVVASWLVVTLCGYFLLVYFTAREAYIRSLSEPPVNRWFAASDLEPAQAAYWTFIGCVVLGPLALAAAAAASFMLAGKSFGRVATLALAAITVPLSLLFLALPWTVAAVVVVIQLRKPESRSWFVRT